MPSDDLLINESAVHAALTAAGHDVFMMHEQCRWSRTKRLVLVGCYWPSSVTHPTVDRSFLRGEAASIGDLVSMLTPFLPHPNPNPEDIDMSNPVTDETNESELRRLRQMLEGVPAMQTNEDGAVVFRVPTITNLQKRAYTTSVAHGWWENTDPHDPMVAGAKIALMHSELSECLEELRKPDCSEGLVAEELADTIIRILDFAGARGLDLQGALLAKMAKNDARPHRHGGKKL